MGESDGSRIEAELYSNGALDLVRRIWFKVGWYEKYSYTFTWMGRPIIQLPEDIVRIQELICSIKSGELFKDDLTPRPRGTQARALTY